MLAKPNIIVETESSSDGVLLVGERSPLFPILREVLTSKGVKVNDPSGFNYIFQLDNLEKLPVFLKKAADSQVSYFLILGENINSGVSQKAENLIQKFKNTQSLKAKIIKISGFKGQEIEAVGKILKIAFSQTPEESIVLTGPTAFWPPTPKPVSPKEKKKHTFWRLAVFFFCLLLAPSLFILANIFLGAWALKNTQEAMLASDFNRARKEAVLSQNGFTTAKNGLNTFLPLLSLLGQEENTLKIEKWLDIGAELGVASGHLVAVGLEGQKLALLVLGQSQGRMEEVLTQLTNDVSLTQRELSLTEAKMPPKPSLFEKNFAQIKTLRKEMTKLEGFLKMAPWILGIGGKRTYLVLLQNNMELRPGGGFIGTIGLLTLNDGLLDFKIEDVYTADGQLRGHVEPPPAIKKYLNQIHWYLRDSNWDPDFSQDGEKAAWFYEKEMGIKPDGVIALDLSLAKDILSLTGPVELSDYQEKITADNFFLKAQTYTQEKFFPGSTQKKDFLGSVANSLFAKLTTEKNFPWFGAARVVEEATQQKHLLAFFNNELAQRLLSEQGWSGEVADVSCQGTACLNDYSMVVEANLGVNKVNYFIKREINKEVNFAPDGLTTKTIIKYENTSPVKVSFGGNYQNYLRVLRPMNSLLEKVMVDGQELPLSKIDQEIVAGKSSAGIWVSITPGIKKTVEVSYKLPLDSLPKEFTYQLLFQKQAGTDKDPLTLKVFAPAWQIMETNFPATTRNNSFVYGTDLLVDRVFTVRLKRAN